MNRLLLLPLLASLTACGGEEPAPEAGAAAGQGGAAEVSSDPTEAQIPVADTPDDDGTEGPGSLRDRVTVTPPPEVEENPFYSTAVTLEERMANVKRALEQAGKTGDV